MTETQMATLAAMPTLKEKAKYLLDFEIKTRIEIVNLTPVLKAVIGEVGLPVTGVDVQQTIDRAKAWLKEQGGLKLSAEEKGMLERMKTNAGKK